MKAVEISTLQFLQQPMQMIVFDPQRIYQWTDKQCQQLWDDVVRVAKDDSVSNHYMGTIIYVECGIFKRTPVPKLILLDGQQRLVTISLLIAALAKKNNTTKEQMDIRHKI